MTGYDIDLIRQVASAVTIPVTALGGAGCMADFKDAYLSGHATGLAGGSFFVYHGKERGVLINYPPSGQRSFSP